MSLSLSLIAIFFLILYLLFLILGSLIHTLFSYNVDQTAASSSSSGHVTVSKLTTFHRSLLTCGVSIALGLALACYLRDQESHRLAWLSLLSSNA